MKITIEDIIDGVLAEVIDPDVQRVIDQALAAGMRAEEVLRIAQRKCGGKKGQYIAIGKYLCGEAGAAS